MADENVKNEALGPTTNTAPAGEEKTRTFEQEPASPPKLSWATRNGLTFESFTPHRDHLTGSVELERSMKPRHLNMIAIGGRYAPFSFKPSRIQLLKTGEN